MRTVLIAATLAVWVGGCGQKKTEPNGAGLTNNQQATANPAAQEGLVSLGADPNPYICNIAKHARASWEAKDYQSATLGMIKLMTLCQTTTQRQALFSSLDQLKQEISRAAAKGDANAKEAAAQLAQKGL